MPACRPDRDTRVDDTARHLAGAVMVALSLSLAPANAAAQDAAPVTQESWVEDAVAQAGPSVVIIPGNRAGWPDLTEMLDLPETLDEWSMDDLMRRFRNRDLAPDRPSPRWKRTGGFGVIVGADGTIVTAIAALPNDADAVDVILAEGETYEAAVVGRDTASGLALLRVDGTGALPALDWSDAAAPALGGEVLTLGRSTRFGASVWTGHVVAQDRERGIMVIDARLDASAAGAPLVGPDGRIVGIVGAGSDGDGAPGHVALAAASARKVVQELSRSGSVARGYLGIRTQTITADLAPALGLDALAGALVTEVEPGTPAMRAGLRSGDVITRIDGVKVTDADALSLTIMEQAPGATVALDVWRDGGTVTVEATLAAMPGTEGAAAVPVDGAVRIPEIGVTLSDLTPDLRADLGLPEDAAGVVVTATDPDVETGADIRVRDIIHAVQMRDVASVADVRDAIATAQADGRGRILLLIERDGLRRFVSARLSGAPG